MPVQNHSLYLLFLLAALICSTAGCLQTPAADDPSTSAFYVPGKTVCVNPADLRSNDSIALYGAPLLLPDTGDYTIQTFGDLFRERPPTYPLSFTVYGEEYSVQLTRANWDMVDDGIDSYTASLDDSDYQSHISITITQNNEILASFPYKNHQIYVEPLYLPAENGLPLHIIYRDTYPEFPALPVLNSSDAIFTVAGHTTLVSPDTLNSSAFLEKYGPVHISPYIPVYNVVFFHDPIPPLGDTVLEIPVTVHGNPYTVHMERIQPEDAGPATPLYTYLGKLSSADSKISLTSYPGGNMDIIGRLNSNSNSATIFGLYFANGTLRHGSIAVPGERISIVPLQTGEYLVNTTNPPYLIYSVNDLLPPVIPELLELPAGELRLIPVSPTDFVGEHPIALTDEILTNHPALRQMVWGIHPPLKAGIAGIADPANYTILISPDEADTLLETYGSGQFLIWHGTYILKRG